MGGKKYPFYGLKGKLWECTPDYLILLSKKIDIYEDDIIVKMDNEKNEVEKQRIIINMIADLPVDHKWNDIPGIKEYIEEGMVVKVNKVKVKKVKKEVNKEVKVEVTKEEKDGDVEQVVNENIDEEVNELIQKIEEEYPIVNEPSALPETTDSHFKDINIYNKCGLKLMEEDVVDNSIDLILTDPPYIISKDTGMNSHYNMVKNNEENNVSAIKTSDEWDKYKESIENKLKMEKGIELNESHKNNYLRYGSIYGKKYCVKTDYGEWDSDFTMDTLNQFIKAYYKKLRKGGTCIIFFDIWKISYLKEAMENAKFKQIRFVEWIKTNPQPLNSKTNYLTNCREIALLGVKGGKPTFNSKYDNAIYKYPIQGGKNRFHPTQKSILLFEDLIKKHSNEGDIVLDTFLGGGTTAIACNNTSRKFIGSELSKEYYDKVTPLF